MSIEVKQVDLINVVAHKLFKEHNLPDIDKKFATELIPNNEEARIFVQNFHKANTTRKGLQYGSFISDFVKYPVQSYISEYINTRSSESFLAMSIKIARKFESVLREDLRTTGGYLIVFSYKDSSKGEIVAIAVMTNKTDSGLDEKSLRFTKNNVLNLETMGLASTVIIERWKQTENELNYLTFMSGIREISDYYKIKFLGCSNVQKSTIATKAVMGSIENYLKNQGWVEKELQPVRDSVVDYFDSHQEEAVLQDILNRVLPDAEEQEEFFSFAEENGYELSASFKPNRTCIKSWRRLVYNKRGIKIEITKERFFDKTVNFSKGILLIKDIDGSLGAEYEKFRNFEE